VGYYAILSPAFIGHLNPMTVLARALQKRGHRVAFLAPRDAETKVARAGLEFIPIALAEFPRGEWERKTALMGRLTGLKASRFAGHWLAEFARGILRDLPETIRRERFDGLVMDQVSIGAESVFQALDFPLAVACSALMFHTESRVPPCNRSWRYRPSLLFRVRNLVGQLILNLTGWPLLSAVVPFRYRHRLPPMGFSHINEMPPSLVITHGGLNTVLECLSEGVPMVALPITNDQPGVASRIAHLGVGECIPIKKLTAPTLRAAVGRVLASAAHKERATQFAGEIGRRDGPSEAAGLIETAFTTRKRVKHFET